MDSERPDEKEGQPKTGNGSSQTPAEKEDIKSLLRAASGVPEGGHKALSAETTTPEGKRAAGAPGVGLIERTKEQGLALKERALDEAKTYKDPQQTQLWKSIFRVSHDRSDPRNRSLAILSNVFLHLHPAKINRDAVRYGFTWGMGGITFYLFIVLTFTGVLLMFYYHPTKVQAFRDILYLEHDVPFGKLLRNMHRWAAHLMVITTWLHMFRVVLTGSYKRPREFNWCVGVVLLVLTLLLSFTGYLLPDDQLGFWAVTVGTNMARATPMLGSEGPFGPQLGMTPYNDVRFGLLGGSIVDANALLRSYIWHCIGIPLVASIFMAVHFWRIRKDGGISGPAPVMLESEMKATKK
ncbi:MAG TPA: cytochrome b N-terminal domain-containing protein [Pyrinomonadaceae bacterium]|jgi:quinol-cytochrome oxidoreductase complex cytochrome b subunit